MPKRDHNLNIYVFGGTYIPKSDLIFKINDHIKEEITNLKGQCFREYGTRLTAHTRSGNIYIYQLEAGQLGAYDKDFPNDFNKSNWDTFILLVISLASVIHIYIEKILPTSSHTAELNISNRVQYSQFP